MNSTSERIYQVGEFRLDAEERVLLRPDGSRVALTPRVFATLRYLIEHSGRVVDKESIMEAVWPDSIVEENNLTQNIATLRRAFGDTAGASRYIVTVPGRGYRLVAPVTAIPSNGTDLEEKSNKAPAGMSPPAVEPPLVLTPKARSRDRGRRWVAAIPWLIGGVALGAVLWRIQPQTPASPPRPVPEKSIAVLPFDDFSKTPETGTFAEGITDEILTRLAKIGGLKVISRTSTLQFKGAAAHDLRDIAARLGVANILEGSVQSSGESMRVSVQLIDARTDTHLWAETFDRNVLDVFEVESEIAQRIAAILQAKLTGAEQHALSKSPTANLDAYNACLKGRYFWNKRTVDGYRQAVGYFLTALELDASYAQAYAGLADAYLFLAGENVPEHDDALQRARAALQKALEIDPELAEAHASAGLLQENFDWDWQLAEKEYKTAIQLQPNYATAHQWYGEFLAYLGRVDEAISESRLACELDPLSLIINADFGKVYSVTRHPDEAIAQLEKTLTMDPQFAAARATLAQLYALKGMREKAVEEMKGIKGWQENASYLCWLMTIHNFLGDRAEAERTLQRLRELASHTYVSPYWMAMASAYMGYADEAFPYLEQAIAEHAPGCAVALKTNNNFDPIRNDPRFQRILERVHLAP